jgi:hypothetical protein
VAKASRFRTGARSGPDAELNKWLLDRWITTCPSQAKYRPCWCDDGIHIYRRSNRFPRLQSTDRTVPLCFPLPFQETGWPSFSAFDSSVRISRAYPAYPASEIEDPDGSSRGR